MSYTRIDVIEPCYAEFGEWVATRRTKLALLQRDVAKLMGVSRASVANLESGNQRILYHQYLQLTEALASKDAFKRALAGREAAAEDLILAKAEQIRRRRGDG